ncbi:toll/interleukin-1 receptor domain-containing protein [Streptomyces sp. NBC_01005]|uniref:TIR domain-containing protein n=1 Tax=unclassified Streptomyces TaxID=2593676 RepID=UPI003868D40F|nr:toll/interleukin-1 receptor domain-containing protein [Streptomyces sp. NBC_01005]WTC99098.1 toll/interleukin-1 receptor domain-containing protein [Streptomyces sp. NBC_01650]
MQIFISWSGERSHAAAKALSSFITDMFDDVRIWMSSSEIEAGERWSGAVAKGLQGSKFGILCCTQDNILAPWLLFEAGALAKSLDDDTRVVPYFIGIPPADLPSPLKQFQGKAADEAGTWDLAKTINRQRSNPRENVDLKRHFDTWWPSLSEALTELPKSNVRYASPMNEMLEYAREEARERALRRGLGVWAPSGDEPPEVMEDMLSGPVLDRWSALVMPDVLKPMGDYNKALSEYSRASAELREFLKANPPVEIEGGISLKHAEEYMRAVGEKQDAAKGMRSKVQEVLGRYFDQYGNEH